MAVPPMFRNRPGIIPITSIVVFAAGLPGFGQSVVRQQSAEPLLRDLPPGVSIASSAEIPAASRDAIGAKLGGKIARLSNSDIRVHGRAIRINVIEAADGPSADAIEAALKRIEQRPFLHRLGLRIVEFVASDPALAQKAAWELGLEPKPKLVRYRVTAELATVDQTDDMAANQLFQAFLNQSRRSSPENLAKIASLAAKIRFGHSLNLRNASMGGGMAVTFEPASISSRVAGSGTIYAFAETPSRHGIPFVKAVIETTAAEMGESAISKPAPNATGDADARLLAATPRWPVDDPAFRELADSITAGKADAEARVKAILAWLEPGVNIRYQGQTGSRWGTKRSLGQKFGHCHDFSDLFVTLARAAGVPARQLGGWLYGVSGHVWAEWRDARGRWLPVDPTGGGRLPCGIYHIPYFTTDDGEMPIVYVAMPMVEIAGTK